MRKKVTEHRHVWEAEQTIEPSVALQLIKEQFPELCAENIRLLGVGWDNTAFVVDEKLIFRFPRREIALPSLENEWCILPKLAPRLSAPIPIPQWKGLPTANFPWPFIGYRMIPGVTACQANLCENERAALAEPIARFLSILHSPPSAEFSQCHIAEIEQDGLDCALLIPKLKKTFAELSVLELLENEKQLQRIIENAQNCTPSVNKCIVHGDFYIRHLLVDDQKHLAGVIDWGDMHLGDPAADLSIMYSFLPEHAHETFVKNPGLKAGASR
jgi:aminoglycoside phosphotransferase (APT) family kinase protein